MFGGVVSLFRLRESVFECVLWFVSYYVNNCFYFMCMCLGKVMIDLEKWRKYGGKYVRWEEIEMSNGGERGKREIV